MATQRELHEAADVISDHLEQETQYGESYRVTTTDLAGRLSLPPLEVGEVLEALAGDPAVPVEKDGDAWLVEV